MDMQTISDFFFTIFSHFLVKFCLILGNFTLNVIYSEFSCKITKMVITHSVGMYLISLNWSLSIVSYLVALLISLPTSYNGSHQNAFVNPIMWWWVYRPAAIFLIYNKGKNGPKSDKYICHFDPKNVLIGLYIFTNMYSGGIYGYARFL